jgi:hypothetical protein
MRRSGLIRRLAGLVTGTVVFLSLAGPARAQFDPVTMSLIMGGFQLATGVAAALTLGAAQDGKQQSPGSMPMGMPCGMQDGVPQICLQPSGGGGFEGSPDLPTGAKPFIAPAPTPKAPSLELEVQPAEPAARDPVPGQ